MDEECAQFVNFQKHIACRWQFIDIYQRVKVKLGVLGKLRCQEIRHARVQK
jgi:hypothetical protein